MKQIWFSVWKPAVTRAALILTLLLAILSPVAGPARAAPGAPTPLGAKSPTAAAWYDGLIQYSTITNCVSIIQGAPYSEKGAGTYVGYLADPNAGQPVPGQVYYIHVVIAGLGNACSGMRAYIDIGLPPNTAFAADTTNKIYCIFDSTVLGANECPQSLQPSGYNPGFYQYASTDTAHANLWPVPAGHFLEIQIPVRSSAALTNASLQAKVWMLDGNSSPWLNPQQGIYVFSGTPSILYANPSTTLITTTGGHSEAILYTFGLGGTGWFDLGTTTSYGLVHEPAGIPAGGSGFKAWDDWGPPPLTPDTLYHWRFTFEASNGQTYYGADQTFRTLPNGVVSVGSGATASCSEADLTAALSAPLAQGSTTKTINFACGPNPVTIPLTSAKTVSVNTVINGGNTVTLDGNNAFVLFNVQGGASLTLNDITLKRGKIQAMNACGGAVHVLAAAHLTANRVTFDANTSSGQGGAICVDSGASAEVHFSSFTSNMASGNGGGAVFNNGTLAVDHSEFKTNTGGSFGGALQNYAVTNLTNVLFSANTSTTNGGAIDNIGTLSIQNSTFRDNITGIRGGAINNYVGTLNVLTSVFTGNSSTGGYGGAIASDDGSSPAVTTIHQSEFTANTAPGVNGVGGALRANGANTTVTNSTFSANQAGLNGGAIETGGPTANLTLLNVTLSGNTAGTSGGNIFQTTKTTGLTQLKNTLVASGGPNNCNAALSSQGNNLETANTCGLAAAGDQTNQNPSLGALGNNGGPTRTMALLAGSPAIDAGTNTGCGTVDQRGEPRPVDGNHDGTAVCDIGAYESASSILHVYLPSLRK